MPQDSDGSGDELELIRKRREFRAIEQFLVAVGPTAAEALWAMPRHEVAKLIQQHGGVVVVEAPGLNGPGYIEYDNETRRARFHRVAPLGQTVYRVPGFEETMKSMALLGRLRAITEEPEPGISTLAIEKRRWAIAELATQFGSTNRSYVLTPLQEAAATALKSGPKVLLDFLERATEEAKQGEIFGRLVIADDVAAFLIFRGGTEKIVGLMDPAFATDDDYRKLMRVLSRIVVLWDEKTPLEAASTFVALASRDGFETPFLELAMELKEHGEQILEAAMSGFEVMGSPEMTLEMFYFGLAAAIPWLRAAESSFIGATSDSTLGSPQAIRENVAHQVNNSEEKRIRLQESLLNAIRDIDGEELAQWRTSIKDHRNAGDNDAADLLLLEAIEYRYFYPRPMRDVLDPI